MKPLVLDRAEWSGQYCSVSCSGQCKDCLGRPVCKDVARVLWENARGTTPKDFLYGLQASTTDAIRRGTKR
jgi:hypothetical protein